MPTPTSSIVACSRPAACACRSASSSARFTSTGFANGVKRLRLRRDQDRRVTPQVASSTAARPNERSRRADHLLDVDAEVAQQFAAAVAARQDVLRFQSTEFGFNSLGGKTARPQEAQRPGVARPQQTEQRVLGAEIRMPVPLRLLCRELHRLLEVSQHRDLPPPLFAGSLPSLLGVAMLLMDGLSADTELLRDRFPRPAAPPRALDVKRLQYLEQPRERSDRRQPIRRIRTCRVPDQCEHLLLLCNAHPVKTS